MTQITLHGGVNEIGGNKMLVEDRATRIFLDFGLSYNQRGKYFEEFLNPRVGTGMKDLIRTGLLPDPASPEFVGAFRTDYLAMMGVRAPKAPSIGGVLLSHIHYDHSAYISFLHEEIPVYSSGISAAMAEALSICSQRDFEKEIYDYKQRPLSDNKQPPLTRKWIELPPRKKTKVGGLEVYGMPVDHSVPGAMAFLIFTSEGSLFYTGDLRVEGYGTETATSLDKMEGEEIDLMLCEGTRINESDKKTEENIRAFASDLCKRAKGLVVADFAFRDVQRLKTFAEVAQQSGRKLVVTPKDALLLMKLRERGLSLPDPRTDDSIEIILEKKKRGNYDDRDYDSWEREFLGWKNAIRSDSLGPLASRRILHAGFFDMTTLLDFEIPQGSIYIQSTSEPHNEEQRIDEKRLQNWLDMLRLSKFSVHASGHACFGELRQLMDRTRPSRVVPMHTEKPELFTQIHQRVTLAEQGRPVSLRGA